MNASPQKEFMFVGKTGLLARRRERGAFMYCDCDVTRCHGNTATVDYPLTTHYQ